MPNRILLVEDEEDSEKIVRDILIYVLGLNDLSFARDGHEAIHMAYEVQPDIILMDLTLPKLSGWEVVRSLKSDSLFKKTPILALTAHAMLGDRERALGAGCDDYCSKPIDVDQFVGFLVPYLGGKPELEMR
jgi:two-component system cell cycle response regulator DivK